MKTQTAEEIIKNQNDKVDSELLEKVNLFFSIGDDISVPLIQRKCRSGYFSASRVLQKLIEEKKVKEEKNCTSVCKVIKLK
jgi:hypothetical protein